MKQRELTIGLGALALAAAAVYGGSAVADPAPQDVTFVQAVQKGNDEEISEARYVLGIVQNPSVRTFANEMISDHSVANVALLKAARNAHVPVPQGMRVQDRATAPDSLKGLTGRKLVTTYLQAQITYHEQTLAALQTEEKSGGDPALRAFATYLEPTVQKHLDNANNIVNLGTQATAPPGPGAQVPVPAPSTAPSPLASSPLPPANASVPTAVPNNPVPGNSPTAAAPPTHAP